MKSDINSPNQMFLQGRLVSLLYIYTVSLIISNKNNLDYKSSTRYMYMIANVIDMTLTRSPSNRLVSITTREQRFCQIILQKSSSVSFVNGPYPRKNKTDVHYEQRIVLNNFF